MSDVLYFYFLFVYIPPPPTQSHLHTYTHTHTLISTHTNHVGRHVCFVDLGYFVFVLSPVNSMFVCVKKTIHNFHDCFR